MKKVYGTMLATALILAVGAAPASLAAQSQTKPAKGEQAAETKGGQGKTGKTGSGKEAASLEGTRWKVTVTPNPAAAAKGEKAFEDEFVFANGKVTLTACVAYGFTASDFKARKAGDGISFETTQTSPSAGSAEWNAKVKDGTLKGTLNWKKAKGDVFHYTVEGKKTGA